MVNPQQQQPIAADGELTVEGLAYILTTQILKLQNAHLELFLNNTLLRTDLIVNQIPQFSLLLYQVKVGALAPPPQLIPQAPPGMIPLQYAPATNPQLVNIVHALPSASLSVIASFLVKEVLKIKNSYVVFFLNGEQQSPQRLANSIPPEGVLLYQVKLMTGLGSAPADSAWAS